MTDGTHTPYERHPTAKQRPRDAADPTRDRSLHSNVNVTWFSSILATNSFRAASGGRDPDPSPRRGRTPDTSPRHRRTPGTGRPGPRAAPLRNAVRAVGRCPDDLSQPVPASQVSDRG